MRRRMTGGSLRNPHLRIHVRRRRLAALTIATAVAAALGAVPAAGPASAGAAEQPRIKVTGNETQPVFSRADAIFQTVHVETTVDSDGDGVRDQVELRILRPRETDQGLRVPTIVEPSPYWAGGNPIENHDVDIDDGTGAAALSARTVGKDLGDLEAAGAEAPAFPNIYDNYFLPRGYAVADVDSLGTGGSTGCPTSGGRNETLGIKAAVDWLNGRARGWDPAGAPVTAKSWSTGSVAMIGQSYNGTLPQAVATTGVPGLKT